MLQDRRPLLHDQVDVPQGDVLDLGLGVQEGDEGRGELPVHRADDLGVAHVEIAQDDLCVCGEKGDECE